MQNSFNFIHTQTIYWPRHYKWQSYTYSAQPVIPRVSTSSQRGQHGLSVKNIILAVLGVLVKRGGLQFRRPMVRRAINTAAAARLADLLGRYGIVP